MLQMTALLFSCPRVAFISDPAALGRMTPLFKVLTMQHGVEAPHVNSKSPSTVHDLPWLHLWLEARFRIVFTAA